MAGDLLVTNIGELSTPIGTSARRGAEMSELRVIEDAAVLIRGGLIVFAGPGADVPWEEADGVPPISADGRAAVPGFVDSHTHFVFAGYRDDEFIWRSQGMPYMEIHRRGGGIRRSMEATRAANLEQLVEIGERRLWTMLSMGVTTVEGKSGYGLDLQTELRQLEAMSILAERTPTAIVATYLGAHAVPPEFEGRGSKYLDDVIEEVLPSVRAQGVARFCDVFCEEGVFDLEESQRYLEAAASMGMGLKIHADEIESSGGAGLAARLHAVSADHLLKVLARLHSGPGRIRRRRHLPASHRLRAPRALRRLTPHDRLGLCSGLGLGPQSRLVLQSIDPSHLRPGPSVHETLAGRGSDGADAQRGRSPRTGRPHRIYRSRQGGRSSPARSEVGSFPGLQYGNECGVDRVKGAKSPIAPERAPAWRAPVWTHRSAPRL